ncbi:hypothetical protein [Agrobacterium vitis]|uniref:hypothetical protein n=1 Tax=Rhizobium/Agrobacterium group TaxID=227290 RepID=UPI00087203D7|nr:hypothetical protein [Agrobacterium vitis]MCE6076738.1 hypothetical protein [Agrobacterium vitis]MCM2471083.1 hypothetical protein [Agrobacterium vitis]MUO71123.1 hypothetical protein [Agrobacterium vitis]MUO84414.1 hypothetical protein [Agrobacterium vitis]MVA38092.1 hypothetical protein [Agrobacterium vitis]
MLAQLPSSDAATALRAALRLMDHGGGFAVNPSGVHERDAHTIYDLKSTKLGLIGLWQVSKTIAACAQTKRSLKKHLVLGLALSNFVERRRGRLIVAAAFSRRIVKA